MFPLPASLLARLQTAPGSVVAPVDVGANQAGLAAWAKAAGLPVFDELPPADGDPWLWLPRRRRDLEELPLGEPAPLFLSGHDLLYTPADWQAALPGQSPEQIAASFASSGGWPGALLLAQAFPGDPQSHTHPQAHALLGPLLPPPDLRQVARRLACATWLTPVVAEALGVTRADWAALLDGGWLWQGGSGAAFPAPLRRFLAPLPDPEGVRCAAQALHESGFPDAALDTLAAGGCWQDHLKLLALTTRSAQGEATLRGRLGALPPEAREHPAALYVAGLLARAAHDLSGAHDLYTRALDGLDAPLAALAHNARGVVRAMGGEVAGALDDFAQAATWPGLSAGEANHNRGTLLVQQGRHAEAERSLGAAVAAFRAAGDAGREARSLETLGTLQFGRGLLREALPPYRAALALLRGSHPADAALALLNLAECHLLLGDLGQAQAHLREAAELGAADPRVRGWTGRLQALVALQAADPAGALEVLGRVTTQDRSLQAEVALLQARAQREQGQPEAARAALDRAQPLGLRAELEAALLGEASLDDVITAARAEEARLELTAALLERAGPDDLREALGLIQDHGYLPLLGTRAASPLAALAHDEATRALFPLHLHLLGPLRLTHAGQQLGLGDFPTRKSAALLVALALADHPQPREVLAERFWPGAKNPLASLQTAVYHLRSVFSVPVVASERGLLSLLFPVRSDLGELRGAVSAQDHGRLNDLLRPLTASLNVLSDLPTELGEERVQAERVLHDALRLHADAQPEGDARRRDALRTLIAADPFDTASREDLIAWHERRGEQAQAEQEREALRAVLNALG